VIGKQKNLKNLASALSGRDANAVNKTVSGLLKLIYPGSEAEVPDEDLEWAVRIALESRRRVKEQQKYIGRDEYGETDFSYEMIGTGVEHFIPVTAVELPQPESESESEPELQNPAIEPNAATQHQQPAQNEDSINGYQILHELTAGGMAEVFVAAEPDTGERVFLKRVRTKSADKDTLEREVRIYEKLLRMNSECVADVKDFVRGEEYVTLITELADGGNLAEYIQENSGGRGLGVSDAKAIAIRLTEAVKDLHSNEVIHRDIKPENILKFGDTWKLADFGIAKNMSRLVTNKTFQHYGTHGYAAPEQFEGVPAATSADVYSLGKTYAYLITGQTDVDYVTYPGWRNIIRKCVMFNADERPTVDEVLKELGSLTG